DAHRLVLAGAEFAHVRGRVQEERAVQVERRLDALVEDPDLRAVADPDDVAVDGDEVARAELADVLLRGRKGQVMFSHRLSPGSDPGVRSFWLDYWGRVWKRGQTPGEM